MRSGDLAGVSVARARLTRHVALLRAINVGGHVVKMDRLRDLFEQLDVGNVETFIASGNVIFDFPAKSTAAMEARIEEHLAAALGYAVATFVRPLAALQSVASAHRFAEDERKGAALYVGFLKAAPDPDGERRLMSHRSAVDDFHVIGREVYWLCRATSRDSKFSGGVLERAVGGPATVRNITTVRKLAAKHDSPPAAVGPRRRP